MLYGEQPHGTEVREVAEMRSGIGAGQLQPVFRAPAAGLSPFTTGVTTPDKLRRVVKRLCTGPCVDLHLLHQPAEITPPPLFKLPPPPTGSKDCACDSLPQHYWPDASRVVARLSSRLRLGPAFGAPP